MEIKEAIERIKECWREDHFIASDAEAVSMAISALEKQMPKKPVFGKAGFRVCPSCGGLAIIYMSDHDGSNLEYCKKCGQKIDWSAD